MSFDISKLQPGDSVAYSYFHTSWTSNPIVFFTNVAKLTKTQIVIEDGTRFHRNSGEIYGTRRRGKLIDPNGQQATEHRLWLEFRRAADELDELAGVKLPATVAAVEAWYDRVSAVIDDSRARLREIGGER